VGTVWVAVAGPDRVEARELALGGDRAAVRGASCDAALSVLDGILTGIGPILAREEPGLG
jgi:nicotinamide mononucleotide (NMN) deamidase PncC